MEKLRVDPLGRKTGPADPRPPARITVEAATAAVRGRRDRSATRKTGPDDLPAWVRCVIRSATLAPLQKAVLLNVATFDWVGIGSGCTAGTALLTRQLGCERKTFKRTVKELVALGLLQRTRHVIGKRQLPNCLRVLRGACLELAPVVSKIGGAPKRTVTLGVSGPLPLGVSGPLPPGGQPTPRSLPEVGSPPAVKPSYAAAAGERAFQRVAPCGEAVAVAVAVVVGDPSARPGDGRAIPSGASVPADDDDDELQRLARAGDEAGYLACYRARQAATATALPVNGAGAGSAPVASASPSPSAGAPGTATAPVARPGAGERPAGALPEPGALVPVPGRPRGGRPPEWLAAMQSEVHGRVSVNRKRLLLWRVELEAAHAALDGPAAAAALRSYLDGAADPTPAGFARFARAGLVAA